MSDRHTKQPPSITHWLQCHPYPHRHPTELPPCKVWKLWSGAGMQPPSLAPVAALIHPDIITPAHHHIITGQSPCKVWKQWSGAGMQPPSLAPVAALIHPDITTPAHRVTTLQGMEAYTMQAKRDAGSRHTSRNIGGRVTHPAKEKQPPQATEGGQWHRRAICLQGNEAGCKK